MTRRLVSRGTAMCNGSVPEVQMKISLRYFNAKVGVDKGKVVSVFI